MPTQQKAALVELVASKGILSREAANKLGKDDLSGLLANVAKANGDSVEVYAARRVDGNFGPYNCIAIVRPRGRPQFISEAQIRALHEAGTAELVEALDNPDSLPRVNKSAQPAGPADE